MAKYNLKKIGVNGFSCYECGKMLSPSDLICVCSDCGAIFCEECTLAGALDEHECDDEVGE